MKQDNPNMSNSTQLESDDWIETLKCPRCDEEFSIHIPEQIDELPWEDSPDPIYRTCEHCKKEFYIEPDITIKWETDYDY